MPSRCEIKIRVSVCFRVKLLLLKYTDNSCIINVVTKDRAGSVQTVNQHHPCRALIVCNAPHPRRQPHAALLIAEVAADRQPVSLPACLSTQLAARWLSANVPQGTPRPHSAVVVRGSAPPYRRADAGPGLIHIAACAVWACSDSPVYARSLNIPYRITLECLFLQVFFISRS